MSATLSAIADLRERVSVREFERRLTRLSRKHQQLVREYLGTPADPRNVPESVWQEIERQHRAALMILLFGAAIPTLEVAFSRLQRTRGETLDQDNVRDELERLSRRRADWVSESVTNTTRDRLDRGFENGRDLDEVVREIFGEDRWTAVARNESVAAQSAGGSSVAEAARNVGIPVTEIWYLGKCDHCDTCPMLHGTSREFWGLWTQGPPLHPHCCCHIQVFFDEQDELIRRRLLVSHNPSFAIVDARMQKFGRARGGGSTTITRSLGEFLGFTKAVEPKDGDGDGLIYDGTEQEQPALEKRPNESSSVENWKDPKPGTKLSIPAVGSRMPFTAEVTGETDEDGNVIVSSEFGTARIPRESLQHFAADMTGDMRFLSRYGKTGDRAVDDVIAGKGKMIGKGNDAVAFEIGDEIVKISSTVPYHPVGGPPHRTIMQMKVAAIAAKDTFETLKAAGVPGLPETRFVQVGDKVVSVQPKLTVGGPLNGNQLQQLRDSVQAIHRQGYAINDQLQFGVGKDGNLYHFDVSSARKSTDNYKKYDEERDVKYVFDQNGGKFHQSVESALENYQQAKDSIEMRVSSGRGIPGWAKRKISEAYEALEDAQHEIAWDVRDFMAEHGIPTAWEESNIKGHTANAGVLSKFFGFTKAKVQGSLFGDDDCGANAEGGGGFQIGNTCGKKRSTETPTEDVIDAKKKGVKRNKNNPTVYFESPIVGPTGVKLHSYAWQYKYEEDVNDNGDERIRKVSDWDAAESNEETGRDIVHHFTIENKDGTSRTVSLETALKAMGYVSSSAEAKSITSIASAVRSRALATIELQESKDLPEWKRDAISRKIEGYTQKIEQLSKMATGSENTPDARRGLLRRAHQLIDALLDQKLMAVIERPNIDKRERLNTAYKTRRDLATTVGRAPDGGRHAKTILADAVPERRVYGVLAKPIPEATDKKITSWYLEKGDIAKKAIQEAERFLEQFHPEWQSIKNNTMDMK